MAEQYRELDFAKLDLTRAGRTGAAETVFAPGKTCPQLLSILQGFRQDGIAVIATRCTPEQAEYVASHGLPAKYTPVSRLLTAEWGKRGTLPGSIAVCTGGTADLPVAEEAAGCAEFFGAHVERHYDIGVAGLHRLLDKIDLIRQADAVIAVAGMEGALGSVLTGLVSAPVIAVPTSVGYGAGLNGLTALLSMLSSCAEGMSVVNIDNGFGAAAAACRILRAHPLSGRTGK